MRRFRGGVTFQHVRREQNSRADALGNEALDGLREPTPRASTVHPAARPSKSAAPKPAAPSLRSDAVTCLRQAAAAWASGQGGPAAEEIWDRLLDVLKRHNVPSPQAPDDAAVSAAAPAQLGLHLQKGFW